MSRSQRGSASLSRASWLYHLARFSGFAALALLILLLSSTTTVQASTPQGPPRPIPRAPMPTPRLDVRYLSNTPPRAPLRVRQVTEYEPTGTVVELPTAAVSIDGQPTPTVGFGHDPLLALMPDFAFSMPAQITVTGINLALVAVLVAHLLFTVQYHFPLSRKNFNLQFSSSVMLLISLSVTLHIILSQLESKSQTWPYMFPYIGVQVPPGDDSWTLVQEVFYLLMRAITTLLIHVTHIQFLTLLFPSALEARLILWMLGPLAIVNSGMEFTALSSDDDFKTSDLGDAIRNICNSTLTLLYTSALIIWGTLVNRRRAWRAGGGTAAFGGGSVGLAIINTAISFIEIKYDRLWWLPNVCWTLTIWQSWMGFWWWVSSGMGIGEVEDRQERLEKKRKRELRRRRKAERQRKKAAGLATDDEHAAVGVTDGSRDAEEEETGSVPGLNGIRRLADRMRGDGTASSTVRSRRRAASQSGTEDNQDPEHIELRRVRIASNADETPNEEAAESDGRNGLHGISIGERRGDAAGTHGNGEVDPADDSRTTAGTGSGSSDTNPTTAASSAPPGWLGLAAQKLMDKQPNFIKARFRRLRLAHVAAARRAATEQSVLREQVLNSSRNTGPGLRHMVFDRNGVARTDGEVGGNGSGSAGGAAAAAARATSVEGNHSRRNSNIVRSSSAATRLAEHSDDRTPPSRRTSRVGGRPDVAAADHLATAAASTHDSSTRHLLARMQTDSPNLSNDTSITRVSGQTTLSGSGSSLRATTTDPGSSDFEHGQRRSSGPAGAAGATGGGGEWLDEEPPARRSGGGGGGGDDDETADSSWFWRGGLRQMRLRDRTRYD